MRQTAVRHTYMSKMILLDHPGKRLYHLQIMTTIFLHLGCLYRICFHFEEKIVDCYPQSKASDGIEQPASLFLVLYSVFCPQWSASGKPWQCSSGYQWLFTFLLLNQECGVNNECSQSIQSVCHSKQTHRMWPLSHQKDHSAWEKVFLSHSAQLAVQYICLKVWYCHRPVLFDCHLLSEIMDL